MDFDQSHNKSIKLETLCLAGVVELLHQHWNKVLREAITQLRQSYRSYKNLTVEAIIPVPSSPASICPDLSLSKRSKHWRQEPRKFQSSWNSFKFIVLVLSLSNMSYHGSQGCSFDRKKSLRAVSIIAATTFMSKLL